MDPAVTAALIAAPVAITAAGAAFAAGQEASARWVVCCGGQLPAGRPSAPGGYPGAGALVGAVGQNGHALAFADPDDPVVRAAVRSWHRPGKAA